jgi:hypothetical protein
VLEIMRNIHIFVAHYNYNLNTQAAGCRHRLLQPQAPGWAHTSALRVLSGNERT